MEYQIPSLEKIKNNFSSKSKNDKQKNTSTDVLHTYDISLIGALESDHEQILKLYKKVLKAAEKKEYATLQLLLVDFATSFTNHIQVEDERLYVYLKKLASNKSPIEQKVVAEFSSEMKDISITIFTFFSQSPYIPVNENNIKYFIDEFIVMGNQLKERIEREEKILYSIYKNSRKVVNIS